MSQAARTIAKVSGAAVSAIPSARAIGGIAGGERHPTDQVEQEDHENQYELRSAENRREDKERAYGKSPSARANSEAPPGEDCRARL